MNINQPTDLKLTQTSIFPSPPNPQSGWNWIDEFVRRNWYDLNWGDFYHEFLSGSGFTSMPSGKNLRLTTNTVLNDIVTFMSTFRVNRTPAVDGWSTRNKVTFSQRFSLPVLTNEEVFIGLTVTQNTMSGLPSNSSALGLIVNTALNANFNFYEGSDSADVTTNTTVAITTDDFIFEIVWDANGYTLTLMDANETVLATRTVVTEPVVTSRGGFKWQNYIKALAAEAKLLEIYGIRQKWE